MARNIEIKAKIDNLDILKKAESLSGSKGTVFPQVDHYFKVPNGRLKLRFSEGPSAELVYYDRANTTGPKLSNYNKVSVEDGKGMLALLTNSLGVRGVVSKKRHLFMVGQTRVHVDQVEKLGAFMELEVVLEENQSAEDGTAIADQLMEKLDVSKDNLLAVSYIDLLLGDV